jgi:hypothetical protein
MFSKSTAALAFAGSSLLFSCASARTRARAPEAASATETSAEIAAPLRGVPYDLAIQATSCWLGGLWSDALREREEDRLAEIQKRCDALLRDVGESPGEAFDPLRAVDSATVDHLVRRIAAIAAESGMNGVEANELTTLLSHVADTARETMHARRAANKVKAEVLGEALSGDYHVDKIVAAPELTQTASLHALLHAEVGPYDAEAQIIGLLSAIDRMEIARGLPKHLKIDSIEGTNRDVFGVPAPALPEDAAAAIRKGTTWLGYASQVAAAAKHPIPTDLRDPNSQEPLAWNGILQGYADKLRSLAADLPRSTKLSVVAHAVVARLDEQYARECALAENSVRSR